MSVSRVIALYTSTQLNKWNLQLGFFDVRKIFLANIFKKFFQGLLGRKALFFCSETKKNSSYYYSFFFSGQTLVERFEETAGGNEKVLLYIGSKH